MDLGKAVFIVALILQIIIRYPYRKGVAKYQQNRQEQLLLILYTLGGVLLPLIYIFTDWLIFANYGPSLWVISLGVVVMAAAMWLLWRSHADLGHNWSSSLEIQENHTLITQGIYRRIRHPMYLAGWLSVAAQAFLLPNWLVGLSGLVTFGLLYFLRVPKEEQMMLKEFGEQYQQYMSKTGRIIPKRQVVQ